MAKVQRQPQTFSAALKNLRPISEALNLLKFFIFLVILNFVCILQAVITVEKQLHKFSVFLENLRPLSEFLDFRQSHERRTREAFEHFRLNYVAIFVTLSIYSLVTTKFSLLPVTVQVVLVLSFARVEAIPGLLCMSTFLCLVLVEEESLPTFYGSIICVMLHSQSMTNTRFRHEVLKADAQAAAKRPRKALL